MEARSYMPIFNILGLTIAITFRRYVGTKCIKHIGTYVIDGRFESWILFKTFLINCPHHEFNYKYTGHLGSFLSSVWTSIGPAVAMYVVFRKNSIHQTSWSLVILINKHVNSPPWSILEASLEHPSSILEIFDGWKDKRIEGPTTNFLQFGYQTIYVWGET